MSDPGTGNAGDGPDRPEHSDTPAGSSGDELDARFADIVAHFDDQAAPTARSYAARPGPPDPDLTRSPSPVPPDTSGPDAGPDPGPGAGPGPGSGSVGDAPRQDGESRDADARPAGLVLPAPAADHRHDQDSELAAAAPADDAAPPMVEGSTEGTSRDLSSPTEARPVQEVAVPWRAPQPGPGPDGLEEHFVPPIPEPLPAGDLQFWAIIVGLVGGPLLLLYLMIFGRAASSWWMLVAVGATAGGFGLLVSRLPAGRDDEDDGARV